jgi:hypothetical protein
VGLGGWGGGVGSAVRTSCGPLASPPHSPHAWGGWRLAACLRVEGRLKHEVARQPNANQGVVVLSHGLSGVGQRVR